MIYGLVPVGGTGSRLGLLFHKELLPLKGYNYYYPVCKFTVDNMLSAGAEKIIFVHGRDSKQEIISYFKKENFVHLNNPNIRQSEVFSVFYENVKLDKNDTVLYGLPDSIYTKNLFPEMLKKEGLVCGMYKVSAESKVGRIHLKTKKFIKDFNNETNSKECWGVLKIDFESMKKIYNSVLSDKNAEAEELINLNNFSLVFGEDYYDLGTWQSLNKYWGL